VKGNEEHFSAGLFFFFLLYEAAITFAGVDKMLECGHFGQQEIAVK